MRRKWVETWILKSRLWSNWILPKHRVFDLMISIIFLVISLLILVGLFVLSLSRGWRILFFWVCLVFFWMWAMFSVSIHESFQLTLDLVSKGVLAETSNYYYFFGQVQKLFIGLVWCAVLYFLPWKLLKKYHNYFFLATIVLVFLLFSPLADDLGKGVTLWLDLWFFTIQPGEFFKLWYIFFLTWWLMRKRKTFDDWSLFISFCVISIVCLWIFVYLSDRWTLMILWPISLIIYWYITWYTKHIWLVFVVFVLGTFSIAQLVTSQRMKGMPESEKSYVQQRLEYFFDPDADPSSRWIGRQTNQALIAVGGWWLFWWGYGKWLQKFGYIPEAQSDFIFAAFSEEVWFAWNLLLLFFYFMLVYHWLKWLKKVTDNYDRAMVVWLLSLLIFQAFVNIGVNVNIIPLTWVTLPFLSHGWSALIINMLEVMLLHKIIQRA